MNLVFTISLPRTMKPKLKTEYQSKGVIDREEEGVMVPFQHVFMSIDVKSWAELVKMLHEQDFIFGREFNPKERHANTRYLEDRGEVVINTQMIGKIKAFNG